MRHVVCDTSVALHLSEVDALFLLDRMGNVFIPKAVDVEMVLQSSSWRSQKPSWVRVRSLPASRMREALAWCQAGLLDVGEAEAIALARHLRADWFLTDDAAARLFSQSLGIEVHGSLGVALWAAAVGELTQVDAEAILNRLANSSLWISAKVLAEAKAALREIYR